MQTQVFKLNAHKWQIRSKRVSPVVSINPIDRDWQLLGECFDEQTARLWAASFDLLEACKASGAAIFQARIDASKVDEANGDRLNFKEHRVYPCNQSVVHATDSAVDLLRAAITKATN